MRSIIRFSLIFLCSIFVTSIQATLRPAITQQIPINQLAGFNNYPPIVKKIIVSAANLINLKLTYLYGSADPHRKGMDCSGTIYYLLKNMGVSDIPRSSDTMYQWAREKGKLYIPHGTTIDFSQLKPGDLLFWSGTYKIQRKIPITHVMLYLGKTLDNKPLMFGASDGRTYQGKKMWGVSVFDFNLPNQYSSAHFMGYSCIPQLTCGISRS